jgi:hypothetical protein
MRRLVTAVTCNDLYFPDLAADNKENRGLWERGKGTYLEAADKALADLAQQYGKKARSWLKRFLREWEMKAKELGEGRHGSFVVSNKFGNIFSSKAFTVVNSASFAKQERSKDISLWRLIGQVGMRARW